MTRSKLISYRSQLMKKQKQKKERGVEGTLCDHGKQCDSA